MDYVGRINVPLVIGPWPIFAADGFTAVEGQAGATDWTLYRDGDVYAAAGGPNAGLVAVSELVAKLGRYRATFTPPGPGNYTLEVRHPGADGGAAVHFEAVIRVDSVTLSDMGGFAVVPLERGVATVGNVVEFRVRFVLPDGTPFEPFELRKVDLLDAATDRIVATIGAANIDALGQGTYRVFTPLAVGAPVSLRDRWWFRGLDGPETNREFGRVVAESIAVGDLLISIERLKRQELGGADLRGNDGRPFSDQDFIESITEATDRMAAELDIILAPTRIVERHDYRLDHYMEFGWFELDKNPVAEILSVRAKWPNGDTLFDIPLDWVVMVSGNFSQFNLVPQSGPLHTALAQNARGVGMMVPTMNQTWPGLFEIAYRAGFDVGKVPPRIAKAIALTAAIDNLNKAGEMILGSGIASQSISIGGLSQSVSTTSSATNAGHGALIIEYRKTLKELLPAIRRQYHGVGIGCA